MVAGRFWSGGVLIQKACLPASGLVLRTIY